MTVPWMKPRYLASMTALWVAGVLPACSKNDSAPPALTGCSLTTEGVACMRASGECVPLQCVDDSWQCAPGETVTALVPGRCSDAGVDAGGNGDAGEAE